MTTPRKPGPVTEAEALTALRRSRIVAISHGRTKPSPLPAALPDPDADRVSSIYRLPPRTMAFVKARAELEGRTVTSVVEHALRVYSTGDVIPI